MGVPRQTTLTILLSACLGGSGVGAAWVATGSEQDAPRVRRRDRDRGELSMMLGGVEWKATSARAKVQDGLLVISGSRMDGDRTTSVVRQSVELQIEEYAGPGRYQASANPLRPSLFVVVGLKADAESDAEMDAALVDTLSKATHVRLAGAEVTIESASDTEIVGTFSHESVEPSIAQGRFRAVIRKARR
jgi:hypothetical protein